MGKKAVFISCFHYYDNRIALVVEFLQKEGYECYYITSDFDHIKKQTYSCQVLGSIQIPTKPYRKNMSFDRIYSHFRFSRMAMERVECIQPDLVYVQFPPNSLCRVAAKYKRKYPEIRLIFDIYDLWPETFPSGRAKALLKIPFRIWGWLRNSGLPAADLIYTECGLYQKVLAKYLKDKKTQVLYLTRPGTTAGEFRPLPEEGVMQLCYLGSINNIIDIPAIAGLIQEIQKLRPVKLNIIGDGESRELLITSVRETGAEVEYHGPIFDVDQRQAIFDRCSFGINVMKESVCVGLTMKSLDYFAGGLPILNTIQADTWDLVEQEGIGVNLCRENLTETAQKICKMDSQTLKQMRERTLEVFNRYFAKQRIMDVLSESLL